MKMNQLVAVEHGSTNGGVTPLPRSVRGAGPLARLRAWRAKRGKAFNSMLGLAAGVWLCSLASVRADAPVIDTDPASQTVGVGTNCTFTVTTTNTDVSFLWLFNDTTKLASTTNYYTVTSAKKTDAGSYSVVLSNATGYATSQVATLTVLTKPSITTQPKASNIAATNTALTLSVTAAGDSLDYQWYKGGSAVSDATTSSLTFSSLSADDGGTYTVQVTNEVGQVTSASAVVTPVILPSITTQPVGKNLAVGASYKLTVAADGLGLHYFWYQNDTKVGTDANSFSISSAKTNNAGTYSVVVSNLAGTVTSDDAVVAVLATPKITTQPLASAPGATNKSLTLSVTATGDSLAYQWYKGGSAVSDATTSSLTFSSLSADDAGTYSVKVTNLVGQVTSANSVVVPVILPSITTQPVGKDLGTGASYTMSVKASSSYLHYFWFQNTTNPVGTDASSLTIKAAASANAGTYSVIVSNLAGTVTSDNATITVQGLPKITTQPTASNPCATNTALTLSVTATGDNLAYQWYKGKTALGQETNRTLVFSSLSTNDAGTYSVTITNRAAKLTSANAVVIPVILPSISTQPVGRNLALSNSYALNVKAKGLYLHYYWSQSTDSATNQVGTDLSSLKLTKVTAANAGTYSVIVSNLAGTVTSDDALITVQAFPKIITQPKAKNLCATNTPLELWVIASGDNLAYQWYKGKTALEGATHTNLHIASFSTDDAGTYSVVITNLGAKVTSAGAVALPVILPSITTHPLGKGLALSNNYVMSVKAKGLDLHYYWLQSTDSATNHVGTDASSLKFTKATADNAGTYSVIVSNLAGTITSSNALLTVEALPRITNQPAALSLKATNNSLTLTVGASGDSLSYQWYKGKTALAGETSYALTFDSLATTNAGTYSVVITNHAAKVTSANAVVKIVPAPALSAVSQVTVLQGANATLKVTVAKNDAAMTYQWSYYGTNDLVGATNLTYTLTNMTSDLAGIYQLQATNLAGLTSTNITVLYLADTNAPTFTLTGAGAFFTNPAVRFNGRATDNVRVSNVVFSVDAGTTFTNLATTTNGWTNFVINTTLRSIGTNQLQVKAQDVNGNWSAVQTNYPVYAPLYAVTLAKTGQGTVTTNWTGQVQWGKTYTVTAKAAPYYLFSGWSGDVSTNAASWSFLCTNDLALTASFVTNQFIGADGTYNGLVTPNDSLTATNFEASCGYLTMTITTNLSYSAKLFIQGTSVAFSGSFPANGTLARSLTVSSNTYYLSLRFNSGSQLWNGSFSDYATWTNAVSIDRAAYSAKNPAPFYGSYTMALPTEPGVGMGTGYGAVSLTISSNGTITASGTAADGTPFSQSSFLSQTGYWPFYAALYPDSKKVNQGMLISWFPFDSSSPHLPVSDGLTWLCPDTNGVLSQSYTNYVDVSAFVAPAPGQRVLTNQLATITFSGAGLTNSYSENMIFANDGTVATDGSAHLSIAKSGLISGTMVDPATGLTNKVYGVVFQNLSGTLGKGSVVGPSSIGNFVITPYGD